MEAPPPEKAEAKKVEEEETQKDSPSPVRAPPQTPDNQMGLEQESLERKHLCTPLHLLLMSQ